MKYTAASCTKGKENMESMPQDDPQESLTVIINIQVIEWSLK